MLVATDFGSPWSQLELEATTSILLKFEYDWMQTLFVDSKSFAWKTYLRPQSTEQWKQLGFYHDISKFYKTDYIYDINMFHV